MSNCSTHVQCTVRSYNCWINSSKMRILKCWSESHRSCVKSCNCYFFKLFCILERRSNSNLISDFPSCCAWNRDCCSTFVSKGSHFSKSCGRSDTKKLKSSCYDKHFIACEIRTDSESCSVLVSIKLEHKLMCESSFSRTSFNWTSFNPNVFSNNSNVSFVLNNDITINLEIAESRRIHIHNYSPLARNNYIISVCWHDFIRPLSSIAPES